MRCSLSVFILQIIIITSITSESVVIAMSRIYQVCDVVDGQYLRFPLALLANPKYREISLEAKMVYALLLNRLTLSQKNGWVNDKQEVYLIYTREEAAATLNVSYKKVIATFRELIAVELLAETRQGRGYPNLLYVLKAELSNEEAGKFTDEFAVENAGENEDAAPGSFRPAKTAGQDMPNSQFKICQNGSPGSVNTAVLDMPKKQASKNNNKKPEISELENSLSVDRAPPDGQADDNELEEILSGCELEIFEPEIGRMFQNAIERLYYSKSLVIGNAVLPGQRVRSYLHFLTSDILVSVLDTLRRNEAPVKNSTAYLMSVIFNAICEQENDMITCFSPEPASERGGYFDG